MIERARVSTAGAAFPIPQSPEDFERMVLSSPQSSFLWTQYMAYHVAQGHVEACRKVAERALRSISVREASELRNIWVAYLNVEFQFGTKESLETLFRRAAQNSNDPEKMHHQLLAIYESHDAAQSAYLLLRSMLLRFKSSTEVWVAYAKHLVRHGKADASNPQ